MSSNEEVLLKDILDHLRKIEAQQAEADKDRKRQAERLERVEKDVGEIKTLAARYKGLFAGILAGGAIVGWLVSEIDNIRSFFRG